MLKQSTIKFSIGPDKMEIVVSYDTKEPDQYTVVFAHHNGKDVTDFYRFCESQQETILYPQIVEGIAKDLCSERITRRLEMLSVSSFNGIVNRKHAA